MGSRLFHPAIWKMGSDEGRQNLKTKFSLGQLPSFTVECIILVDIYIFRFSTRVRFGRAHALERIRQVSEFEYVWAFCEDERAANICRNEVAAFCWRHLDYDIVWGDKDRFWVGQRVSQFNQELSRDIVPREDDVALAVNVPVEARIALRTNCVPSYFFKFFF